MKKIVSGLYICSIVLLLASCSDEYTICETPVTVSLNGTFYKDNAGTPTIVQPGSFSVSNLNGNAIYTNTGNRSNFSISLVANADTSRFVISIDGATADTFKVAYSTQIQTVSASCGDINTFTVSSIATTNHTVDSIKVVNMQVNTLQVQHFMLFY